MVTKPVTLRALIRVCADLAKVDDDNADGRVRRWAEKLSVWKAQQSNFTAEGFYERFPAKGQTERVQVIHRALAQAIGLSRR